MHRALFLGAFLLVCSTFVSGKHDLDEKKIVPLPSRRAFCVVPVLLRFWAGLVVVLQLLCCLRAQAAVVFWGGRFLRRMFDLYMQDWMRASSMAQPATNTIAES